jgi:hypothetical protein
MKKYEKVLAFLIVMLVIPMLLGILGTLISETWR